MDTSRLLLTLVAIVQLCHGTKVWPFDLNFDNPSNWVSEELPKPGQSVHFPARLNGLSELPASVNVGSINLPASGALLIPETGFSMVFSNEKTYQKPAAFKVPTRRAYYSAKNWVKLDETRNTFIKPNEAVPHLDRIPCQYETVIFSKAASPVDLQYHEAIEIKDVNYGGEPGLDEFRQFIVSDLGQYVFRNAEETLVREGKCGSSEKCPCHADWVRNLVCENEVCEVPLCLNPITPVGHCCAICGSMLVMDLLNFGENFALSAFSKKLEMKIISSEVDSSQIDYHIGVYNGALQLVIVDQDEYNERSVQLMNDLELFFKKHFTGHKILNSGHPYKPYESGQLFLFMFMSLLVVSIFFTMMYVYYYDDRMVPQIAAMIRNRQFFASPFVFARFDPSGANEDSSVDININPSGIENLNSSFNNPMFEENVNRATSSSEETGRILEDESYVNVELKDQN